jgi:hypothetical protein
MCRSKGSSSDEKIDLENEKFMGLYEKIMIAMKAIWKLI